MDNRQKGCLLANCGCVLGLILLWLLMLNVGPDKEALRQSGLVVLLAGLLLALGFVGGRSPQAELWKCESCGAPNPESSAGCAVCGKHRS